MSTQTNKPKQISLFSRLLRMIMIMLAMFFWPVTLFFSPAIITFYSISLAANWFFTPSKIAVSSSGNVHGNATVKLGHA